MRTALLTFGCLLLAGPPAWAQIYSWRDGAGALVLSNHPRGGGAPSEAHAAPASSGARVVAAGGVGATPYDDIIRDQASATGLSPDLIKAVIQVESAFDPAAISPKGAMGLMQLMPATARELGVRDPFQPRQNIAGGAAYLKRLLDRYGGDLDLALAAYNAGPGAVARYGAVPPYRETQDYVRKVTGAAPAPPPNAIYKWIEIVDGRPVRRYSNRPPAGVAYQIVGGR